MSALSATPAAPVSIAAQNPVLSVSPLGFPWKTVDPFLFCAHHDDAYPAGNGKMGLVGSLARRDIGQDFSRKDGWSMYHGDAVPGFPPHPHRGFETVTVVRKGLIDLSDSLGVTARCGQGDAQWLTAGGGVVHSHGPRRKAPTWRSGPCGWRRVRAGRCLRPRARARDARCTFSRVPR